MLVGIWGWTDLLKVPSGCVLVRMRVASLSSYIFILQCPVGELLGRIRSCGLIEGDRVDLEDSKVPARHNKE